MLELSAAVWVRTASGLAWLALGALVLALVRGRGDGAWWGLALAASGAEFALYNLFWQDAAVDMRAAAIPALLGIGGAAAFLASWRLARSREGRAWLGVAFVLSALGALVYYVATAAAFEPATPAARLLRASLAFASFGMGGLAALPLACAEADRARAKGAILAALGFGVFVAFIMSQDVARGLGGAVAGGAPYAAAPLAVALLAAVRWLVVGERTRSRAAVGVALGIAGAACAAALLSVPRGADDTNSFVSSVRGILRMLTVALVAAAFFRHRFLALALPRLVEKRATLAAVAVAAVFIVAEIAQNYLSAEYGLLMGGIVAGALLFAATPIQRAMERSTSRAVPVQDAQAEHAYRLALRAALADGALTPEEQDHLAELAQHLAIGAADARRLQKEEEGKREHV